MSKTVKIIRHVDCEGPGYIQEVLQRNAIPFTLIKVDENEAIPGSLDDTLAIISMGGGMSVNDNLPWIAQECDFILQADNAGIPVLGHCLGAQLIAKALGAQVVANPVKEIGWLDVYAKTDHALFSGVKFPSEVFHWHGETFHLPTGAVNLLASENCENQAFIKGSMLAFQCHMEMTEALVTEWVHRFKEQLDSEFETVQSAEVILNNLAAHIKALNLFADKVYQNWIDNFLRG